MPFQDIVEFFEEVHHHVDAAESEEGHGEKGKEVAENVTGQQLHREPDLRRARYGPQGDFAGENVTAGDFIGCASRGV
jgi:hypothetical protein